ncbi:substrate-binding domain-containing protein [Plastoroseomonas hellenica]|uniref:substrate-binding domain-containing protein n=1 Tax=Plastoroseomonas hellenica TaxID=2687306 RepID=UPI001BADD058|nr:substrate-binding domain-containing protein [Plastoroseomonas hellenica]MBR0645043.1 ABC transporter substrate-binding protein [Plastoroseomonas hellenica]
MAVPLRVLTTLGLQKVIEGVLPQLQAAAGRPLELGFGPTQVQLQRLAEGAAADVVIVTEAGIAGLAAKGLVDPASRVDLARSAVGAAVRAGAPKPDIGSVEALVATLRAVPSIVYSKQGASGIFFAGLIERLGIADLINAKATIIPQGFTAALVARGEAALAIQQMSELMAVEGVEIVGPLPDAVQEKLIFSGAVTTASGAPEAGYALLAALASACTPERLGASGLRPV